MLTASDVGSTIRVRETAHNPLGSGSADSAIGETVVSDVPSIAGFNPTSGITGSGFTVTGTGFDTTNQVQLGKLTAAFTVLSPTKLEVTVPNGAASGKLTVITGHGSTTSKAKFTVTLSIKSFKAARQGHGSDDQGHRLQQLLDGCLRRRAGERRDGLLEVEDQGHCAGGCARGADHGDQHRRADRHGPLGRYLHSLAEAQEDWTPAGSARPKTRSVFRCRYSSATSGSSSSAGRSASARSWKIIG